MAIVTGGSSGIGAAICAALGGSGWQVVNADLAAPDDLAPSSAHLACDVRSDDEVTSLFREVEERFGRLHLLVNNAGEGGSPSGIAEVGSADWEASLAALLGGPRRTMSKAVPLLRRTGGGAIVNIASVCARQPGWGPLAYSVAKAALVHLSRMAAAELAVDLIRVNSVSPGFIATPIFGRSRGYDRQGCLALAQAIREQAGAAQPLPIAGTPDDIAAAVLFLAGASGRFVTGVDLAVDGGLSLAPAHLWDETSRSPVARAVEAGVRRLEESR